MVVVRNQINPAFFNEILFHTQPTMEKICLHLLQQVFSQSVFKLIHNYLVQEPNTHFILFVTILTTVDNNKEVLSKSEATRSKT